MSYISAANSEILLNGRACGPGCNCGPCKSRGGVGEWYVRENPAGLSEGFGGRFGFGALSEPDDVLYENSKAALDAALKRNPAGGYTRGSAARQALEDAIKSVPKSLAVNLHKELNEEQTPLAKLFKRRLARQTRQSMKNILTEKETQWIEGMHQQREELRRRMCAVLKQFEGAVEEVCRTSGEESDACLKARFDLLTARERNNMQGTRCP